MPEVGDHREFDRVVEVPVGPGENADALRPGAAGVAGDAAGLAGRRGGEALADPLREAIDEDGGGAFARLVSGSHQSRHAATPIRSGAGAPAKHTKRPP